MADDVLEAGDGVLGMNFCDAISLIGEDENKEAAQEEGVAMD